MLEQVRINNIDKDIAKKKKELSQYDNPKTQSQAIRYGEKQQEISGEISNLQSKKHRIDKTTGLGLSNIFGSK